MTTGSFKPNWRLGQGLRGLAWAARERRWPAVLWPSFLMAGVVEMLVFSMVDPADLRWMGSPVAEADAMTIYSAAFLLFWVLIALASAMTQLVMGDEGGPCAGRHPSA